MDKDLKGKLQFTINKYFPKFVGKVVYRAGQLYRIVCMPQIKKSYGIDNDDKYIYIIRQLPPGQGGVLCNYNYTIMQVLYAESKGWIPVVDMENYSVIYSSQELINNTMNAWEYYFDQPGDISLSDAYNSKNVVLSSAFMSKKQFDIFFSLDDKMLKRKIEVATKMPLNDRVMFFLENHAKDILEKVMEQRVLGVYCRGTLYNVIAGHQHRKNSDVYVEKINEQLIENNYDNIFIISDEQEFLDELIAVYPNALYTMHPRQKKYDVDKTRSFQEVLPEGSASTDENLMWYLTDVFIFSRCLGILGSMNNGFYTSILWNAGNYEKIIMI